MTTPYFIITLGDIFGIVILILFLVIGGGWLIGDAVRKWRCKHEKYFENMACHAICQGCGKDLGFIGTVRGDRTP